MTSQYKVIFLDFDGVLINHKSWYVRSGGHATGDPPCVVELNRITDLTGARIVISSSWRIGTSVAELRSILLSWGVTGKVIGKTPRLLIESGTLCIAQPRGSEIQSWIDKCERVERFVILDDDSDMGPLTPFLVKTKFETGLTTADANRAIAVLQHLDQDVKSF